MTRKIVILTEKPSVTRPVVEALIPSARKENGGFRGVWKGHDIVVIHSNGHLFTAKEPKDYNEKWRKWRLGSIPDIMDKYGRMIEGVDPIEYKVIPGKEQLAKQVKYWFDWANLAVLATDPDEQGFLIADLVKRQCGYTGEAKTSPILDLTQNALRKQFADIESLPPDSIRSKAVASEAARSLLDEFLGYNLSRTLSLIAKQEYPTLHGKLIVGRIQTPILGLIGRRELEISNHSPIGYFNIYVNASDKSGNTVRFALKTDRIEERAKANKIRQDLAGTNVIIDKVMSREVSTPPPDPYKLDTLQTELYQKFKYSPLDVLDAVDANYKAKLNTYPRTDCNRIHHDTWESAPEILKPIISDTGIPYEQLNFTKKGKAVFAKHEDMSVAHYGLTPTGKTWPSDLPKAGIRWEVHKEITIRFAQMFMPNRKVQQTKVIASCGSYTLEAAGAVNVVTGWYEFSRQQKEKAPLPLLTKSQELTHKVEIKPQSTKAPSRYTIGDINTELASIGKHLSSTHQHLKFAFEKGENSGLGSAATRSGTIKSVFDHGVLQERSEGKREVTVMTRLGKAMFEALPDRFTLPDLFAEWENDFREIIKGNKDSYNVIKNHSNHIKEYIEYLLENNHNFNLVIPQVLTGYGCPSCGKDISRQVRTFKEKESVTWLCIHCKTKRPDFKNAPLPIDPNEGTPCDEGSCDGTYTPVSAKNKEGVQFKALSCSKCRAFKTGSFVYGDRPRPTFRGAVLPIQEGEGSVCDFCNKGSYQLIVRKKQGTDKVFKVLKCSACKKMRKGSWEWEDQNDIDNTSTQPEVQINPALKAQIEHEIGHSCTTTDGCSGKYELVGGHSFKKKCDWAALKCNQCLKLKKFSYKSIQVEVNTT